MVYIIQKLVLSWCLRTAFRYFARNSTIGIPRPITQHWFDERNWGLIRVFPSHAITRRRLSQFKPKIILTDKEENGQFQPRRKTSSLSLGFLLTNTTGRDAGRAICGLHPCRSWSPSRHHCFRWELNHLMRLEKRVILSPTNEAFISNSHIHWSVCRFDLAPNFAAYHVLKTLNERWKLCHLTGAVGSFFWVILCGVSLGILTAISVDRPLALSLRLRYRRVVTLNRVRAFVFFLCLLNTVNASPSLWHAFIFFILTCAMIVICLIASTFC